MLYDRVLKCELMNSDRWLDLASDSHRLAYVCLLPLADDFGNFEGGLRRVWRWLHARTQIRDEAHASKVLSDLMDADLLRCYKVAEAEFWHIARFECDRRYICRRVPASPWDDPETEKRAGRIRETRKARTVDIRSKTAKVAETLPQSSGKVAAELVPGAGAGAGVGDGVGEKQLLRAETDPTAQLWSFGVEVLMRDGKKPLNADQAKQIIGLFRKSWPDQTILDALQSAIGTDDPKAYARAVLKDKPKIGETDPAEHWD